MSEDVTPTELARAFHDAYERLAPAFGYKTREESRVPFDQLPYENRMLMLAVAKEILDGILAEMIAAKDAILERLAKAEKAGAEIERLREISEELVGNMQERHRPRERRRRWWHG